MNDDGVIGELDFALRQYAVSTEHLIITMAKYGDDIPPRLLAALDQFVAAINREWQDA